jgi:anti-sigma regulatory factor (Ser/Thr protein kinase)
VVDARAGCDMGDSRVLLALGFEADRITAIRHAVSRAAESVGLHGQRREDFVLAVNEIVTNAVRHAGGHGRLRLWLHGGSLRCEVADDGGGIPVAGPAPVRPAHRADRSARYQNHVVLVGRLTLCALTCPSTRSG